MAQVEGWDVVDHCAIGTDGSVPALKVVPFQLGAKRSSRAVVPAAVKRQPIVPSGRNARRTGKVDGEDRGARVLRELVGNLRRGARLGGAESDAGRRADSGDERLAIEGHGARPRVAAHGQRRVGVGAPLSRRGRPGQLVAEQDGLTTGDETHAWRRSASGPHRSHDAPRWMLLP